MNHKGLSVAALCVLILPSVAAWGCGPSGRSGVAKDENPTVSNAALEASRKHANPEQLAILADGAVSFNEYDRAALSYISCLTDAGIEVEVAELRYSGKYYEVRPVIPGDRFEALDPERRRCLAEYVVIFDLWSYQNMPTEAEMNEARRALAACISDAGVSLPEEAGSQEISGAFAAYPEKVGPCVERIQEEYAMPGWVG